MQSAFDGLTKSKQNQLKYGQVKLFSIKTIKTALQNDFWIFDRSGGSKDFYNPCFARAKHQAIQHASLKAPAKQFNRGFLFKEAQ